MTDTVIIKNRDKLATSALRRQAMDIIEAGIMRVLPDVIIQTALKFERPSKKLYINAVVFPVSGRIFVVGGGKASGLMAQALEKILGVEAITAGLVTEKADPREFKTRKIKIVRAAHPIPDDRGVKAVSEMLALKTKYTITQNDLIICLLSGGGSALMPCPLEGVSLSDKQKTTDLLLSSGADIKEINTVRKHLSRTKGGRLARHFAPSGIISLILSDVIGNDLSVIASGPTYPDASTYQEAYAILKKYHLSDKVPEGVIAILEAGGRGEIEETPKALDNAVNYIIGDNRLALEAMAEKSCELGFTPLVVTSGQTGETAVVARERAGEILNGKYQGYNALLFGGETTPQLPDKAGKGGRNQHYAAVSLEQFTNYHGEWLAASIGTDGSDFIPEVAGAIVDGQSFRAIEDKKLDLKAYLERYDSYNLLSRAGNSLVATGNTHTNVGDIILYLLGKERAI
jgi:hydroxypyruvate reductase/glycerate 2-kinase